jgi:hypothetical protein
VAVSLTDRCTLEALIRRLPILLLALAACPPPAPAGPVLDARDVTRCDHGRTDDQSFIKPQWKACDDAARALIADVPGSALRYARAACDLDYAQGCLDWLEYTLLVATHVYEYAQPHIEPARKKGAELCRAGLVDFEGREAGTARACTLAARLYRDFEPHDDAQAAELERAAAPATE